MQLVFEMNWSSAAAVAVVDWYGLKISTVLHSLRKNYKTQNFAKIHNLLVMTFMVNINYYRSLWVFKRLIYIPENLLETFQF